MENKTWIILLCSLASGWLYRAGGKGKPFNTKYRDIGVPIIFVLASYFALGIADWQMIGLSGLLLFGALTTYFKKSGDPQPKHWFVTGLAYGISAIPLLKCGVSLYDILLRTVILSIGTAVFFAIPHDDISERGRGFIIIATLLLLI